MQKVKAEQIALVQAAKNEAESILAGATEEIKRWEAEKAALAGVQQFEPIVKLDVGGVRCTTSLTTLNRFPDSMIGCMFSGRHALPKGEDGYFFIDRDGTHFRHILNFLRSPEGYKVEIEGADERELRRECEYYGIDQLMIPATPTATGTEKCLLFKTLNGYQGGIAVLVDQAGVYTILDTGEKIEYCPHCDRGIFCARRGKRHFIESFSAQALTAAQPRVQGRCPLCGHH
ncbi:BTB/POZ protein [Ochromonadaceae sp. CCMP2298]|nr:BTB/POZ protein [Ochromonadaceae sp. CCMP2298]